MERASQAPMSQTPVMAGLSEHKKGKGQKLDDRRAKILNVPRRRRETDTNL